MKLLVLNLVLLVQFIDSQIVTKIDHYLLQDKKILQKMEDDQGKEWQKPVSPFNLELLCNDKLLLNERQTCRDVLRNFNTDVENNMESKDDSKMFQEMAVEVGFDHVHRENRPQRGACNFDFIVPSRYQNTVANLTNELCTMEMLTGGAAVGDYDGDGLQDIFFTRYMERSVLYRNMGNGLFKDVTLYANVGPDYYGNGATWVDVDSDGDLDLYVTTVGGIQHYLYINHGGHFTEEAMIRNASLQCKSGRKLSGITPTFGDFDNDGYMDMYVSEWIYHYSTHKQPSASRLLRNMGAQQPGYFEDVTNRAGVNMDDYWRKFRNYMGSGTHTFGASFTDFDNDGWLDLFVIGDFGQSKLFWNNKNGTFSDCTFECGITGMKDAMGFAIGDLNNDGLMDIFVSAIYYTNSSCKLFSCKFGSIGNGLYLNKGKRMFVDVTDQVGVRDGNWGWGSSFLDYDNDGYLDLVLTNGIDGSSTTLDDEYGWDNMKLFHNQGEGYKNKMVDVAKSNGIDYNGFGRGLLVFDYDNDGDEDIVVAANIGRPQFFKNKNKNGNSWITINAFHKCLNNKYKVCESQGSRVTVTRNDGLNQTSIIGSKSQFLGQSESAAHFGFGKYNGAITVTVWWLRTKKVIKVTDVTLNQFIKIIEPESLFQTIAHSKLVECPRLQIKSISTQPLQGEVKINADKTSVLYNPGDLTFFDLDVQEFEYVVSAVPSSSINDTKERVKLNFRVSPNDFLYPKCDASQKQIGVGRPIPIKTNERRFDGVSNNIKNLHWGAAQQNLLNIAPLFYGDNISDPASSCTSHERIKRKCPFPMELGGIGSHRPSPRVISNTLMAQSEDIPSFRNVSDFASQFGQFLSHDTDHTSELPRFEFQYHHNHVWMPINIPKGDIHFDPYSTGKEKMAFIRSEFNRCTGGYPGKIQRRQQNKITSYIDANMVYGIDLKRCSNLRTFKNGELRIGKDGLLIKNEDYLPNANPTSQPSRKLYIAGDVRANTQPGLAMQHTLWVREHNRLAKEYKESNPSATEEEIFLKSRRLLISELQYIAYNEYLPSILGGQHIPPYKGYNESVDVSVSTEFSTAAFRFGHSQVNSKIFRLDEHGAVSKYGHALLREVYFKPNRIDEEGGIDPIIRGSVAFPTQHVDLLMVDEMRNNLFPTKLPNDKKNTGFDLASLNIQRGRDHGLADLNTLRKNIGLKTYTSFDEITSNKEVARKMKELYSDVNNIDLWVGGLAEDHVHNSELGGTFHAMMVEQFTRTRDGDRFWYQHNLTKEEIKKVESMSMGKIIRLNTEYKDCPDNVFFSSRRCKDVKNHQCVSRPCRDADCHLEFENVKLNSEVNEQKLLVRCLIIIAGILAALCVILILGAIVVRGRLSKKTEYPVSNTPVPIQLERVTQVRLSESTTKRIVPPPYEGLEITSINIGQDNSVAEA